MKQDVFEQIVKEHIALMFSGSAVQADKAKHTYAKQSVFLRNQCELVVRNPSNDNQGYVIRKSQAFEQSDASFVRAFVEHLGKLGSVADLEYLTDLIGPLLRRSVAEILAPHAKKFVVEALAQLERWSEETYEGRRVSAAIGVETKVQFQPQSHSRSIPTEDVNLLELFTQPYGVVLLNGLESFLRADQKGRILGHEAFRSIKGNRALFSPLRFCPLAAWSKGNKIGLCLNRNGEILVFRNKALLFCKRRSMWRHFAHEATLKRMALRKCFDQKVCRAVYRTCLDVSFARTGGGIAMAKRTELNRLMESGVVSSDDCTGSSSFKGRFLQTVLGKPFQQLDRRLRQDLVAMDGATILDYQGNIVAAGAIVNVDAGSEGGGRLAAAKALSRYGLAMKVSADGEIRAFKGGDPDPEELFRIG